LRRAAFLFATRRKIFRLSACASVSEKISIQMFRALAETIFRIKIPEHRWPWAKSAFHSQEGSLRLTAETSRLGRCGDRSPIGEIRATRDPRFPIQRFNPFNDSTI
jgi:hypothetical protein